MQFVGKGKTSDRIMDYCKENGIENIFIKGFYQKQEEASYIREATMMNIFYPRIITHDTALSNRFYNSLVFRKPMLVTKDTVQGDYAEKYGLGLAVVDCANLPQRIESYLKETDFEQYSSRCIDLLKQFLKEQDRFESIVEDFVCS